MLQLLFMSYDYYKDLQFSNFYNCSIDSKVQELNKYD